MSKGPLKPAFEGLARAAAKLQEHLDHDQTALLLGCIERAERLLDNEQDANVSSVLKQTIVDIQSIPLFDAARERARDFLFAYGQMLDAIEAADPR